MLMRKHKLIFVETRDAVESSIALHNYQEVRCLFIFSITLFSRAFSHSASLSLSLSLSLSISVSLTHFRSCTLPAALYE